MGAKLIGALLLIIGIASCGDETMHEPSPPQLPPLTQAESEAASLVLDEAQTCVRSFRIEHRFREQHP